MKVILINDEGVARVTSVEPQDGRPPRFIDIKADRAIERYVRSVVNSQNGKPVYVLHEVK